MPDPVSLSPVETGLILPQGPVTVDFKKSIASSLDVLIPEGQRGALLAVASFDSVTGKPKFVFGVATKLNQSGTWKLGSDVQWNGEVTGRVMLMGSW